jgi:hypothetical protein
MFYVFYSLPSIPSIPKGIPKLSNSNCIESLYSISEKPFLVTYKLQVERL